jgi:hypothetical protein
VTPGFEFAPVAHPGEQHAGGLEKVAPHHGIAASGDPAAPVDLARGSAARSRCCLWKPVSKPRLAVRG